MVDTPTASQVGFGPTKNVELFSGIAECIQYVIATQERRLIWICGSVRVGLTDLLKSAGKAARAATGKKVPMAQQPYKFEGKVQSYDPKTKVVTLEGGKVVQLGRFSRQKPEPGQTVQVTVSNRNKSKIGGEKPVKVERFEVTATQAPSSAPSVSVNTRDNR